MVSRVNIGQEEVTILIRTLSDSTCDDPEFLGNEMLPNKCLEKNKQLFLLLNCIWQLCDTQCYCQKLMCS